MQTVQGTDGDRERLERSEEDRRGQFKQYNASQDTTSKIPVRPSELASVNPVPDLVLEKTAGDEYLFPKALRWDAMIYKLLPDVKLAWRNVRTGAAVTAVLFTIGKSLIGLYLGRSTVASVYGAAGSLIVILLWVYYSAQIVFFGAEFTKVY